MDYWIKGPSNLHTSKLTSNKLAANLMPIPDTSSSNISKMKSCTAICALKGDIFLCTRK